MIHKSNPEGVMVIAVLPNKTDRNSVYLGRMLVVPRRKEWVFSNKWYKIREVNWQLNDAAGEFEVHLILE